MQSIFSKRFLNGYSSSSFLYHSQPHSSKLFTTLNTPVGGNSLHHRIQCFPICTGKIFHGYRPNFRSLVERSGDGFLEARIARGYRGGFDRGFRSYGSHWGSCLIG